MIDARPPQSEVIFAPTPEEVAPPLPVGVGSLPPLTPTAQELEEDEFASIRMLLTWSVSSLLLLALAVAAVAVWAHLNDELVGGPSTLLTSRSETYRMLTQFNEVGYLVGSGVDICIVDTGLDLTHDDLSDVSVVSWKDFVLNKPSPYDDEGHGTAMTGLLVANGGLTGHATGVNLHIAKALGADGSGDDEKVADAIDWCVTKNADVISLSLGGAPGVIPGFLQGESSEVAVNNAIDLGIYVIAAAGNDGEDDNGDVENPGGVEDVICVGGVGIHAEQWSGTSRGDNNGKIWPPLLPRQNPDKKPEVVAPADRVPVILPGGWGQASGTSAATVYVTAAVALLLEARPDLQHEGDGGGNRDAVNQMKEWLRDSAKPRDGQTDHDDHYGYGLLQVKGLLNEAGGI